MKTSKLNSPVIKVRAVRALAAGETQEVVAQAVGVDQSAISRWTKRDDIRQALEEEGMRLASSIPAAVENYKGLIGNFDKLTGEDKKLGFRATTRLLEATGILNNPQPGSIFVSFKQNNNYFGSEAAKGILERLSDSFHGPQVEGEIIDYEG